MMVAGERVWNLFKVMNVRKGASRNQDTYLRKWLEPLEKPNGEKIYFYNKYNRRILYDNDFETMIDDYYDERGWNKKCRVPTVAKLAELGLQHVIRGVEAYQNEVRAD